MRNPGKNYETNCEEQERKCETRISVTDPGQKTTAHPVFNKIRIDIKQRRITPATSGL